MPSLYWHCALLHIAWLVVGGQFCGGQVHVASCQLPSILRSPCSVWHGQWLTLCLWLVLGGRHLILVCRTLSVLSEVLAQWRQVSWTKALGQLIYISTLRALQCHIAECRVIEMLVHLLWCTGLFNRII